MYPRKKKEPKGSESSIIHTRNDNMFKYPQDCYRIISVDPGIANLAIRIELRCGNNVITEVLQKHKISSKNDKENVYINLINILLTYEKYYKECHFIIMEKQLSANQKMIKLSQHILSFFLINTRNNNYIPIIVELDSKIKSRILPKCTTKDKKERKKQSIVKAMELLACRNDVVGWNIINKEKKKDDVSDVVVQAEAFWLFCIEIYTS